MSTQVLKETATALSETLLEAAVKAEMIANNLANTIAPTSNAILSPLMVGIIVFTLAVFVGYYVVWKVTPALHSPLMAVTNAISSVIIVGGILAAGSEASGTAKISGFIAILLASINIFGGFAVTKRMLAMFDGNKKGGRK